MKYLKKYNLEYKLKIQELREELAISQDELAQKIGVSSRSIRNYENYDKEPNTISKALINKFYKQTFNKA